MLNYVLSKENFTAQRGYSIHANNPRFMHFYVSAYQWEGELCYSCIHITEK